MGFFKRKADPISDRTKALNARIAALEAQIKKLDSTVQQSAQQPRVRSTAPPQSPAAPPSHRPVLARDPIFEPVDHRRLEPTPEDDHTPDHYNDLGVRKYDLAAALRRFRGHFRGPPASNPKLVTYLAAGSIRGLRPLRYEKRIARNRFIALFLILVFLILGIIATFLRR
jgi:hypothetical protein